MSTLRFFDIGDEPTRMLTPIEGYQDYPLMPLNMAVEPLIDLVDGIQARVCTAENNCSEDKLNTIGSPLTQDEAASIYLYTIEWTPSQRSLYYILNRTLRSENRQELKPWFSYLKLFFTALYKLPSNRRTIWRGIKENLSSQYPIGKQKVWWGVSSCTETVKVLESSHFLGKTGDRTLFSIECRHGKQIRPYSHFQTEAEIILMPGTFFEVVSQAETAPGLHLIHLKEIRPPHSFVQPPFPRHTTSSMTVTTSRPTTATLPSTIQTHNQEWSQQHRASLRKQIEEKKMELIRLQGQKRQREQNALQDAAQYSQILSPNTSMYSSGYGATPFTMFAMNNVSAKLSRDILNQARTDMNYIDNRISNVEDEIRRLEREEERMGFY